MISRLTHGFSDRCLRFTSAVADTRARLASGWRAAPLPGGSRTLWIASKGFDYMFILLPRAYPDASWSHSRRKFFVLADVTARARGKPSVIAPLAFEAVKRIDAIFAIEREINGRPAEERLAVRRARTAPLVSDLEAWMRNERGKLSRRTYGLN